LIPLGDGLVVRGIIYDRVSRLERSIDEERPTSRTCGGRSSEPIRTVFVRSTCALLGLLLLINCNGSPTEPIRGPSSVSMSCVPEGTNVRCAASAYNIDIASRDVTATGEWLFTGVAGAFAEPGLFVPASHGEVTIWVRYRGHDTATKSTFLVGPNEPAQRLYWVAGLVIDAASGERISGATVYILDGYAAGKSAMTNENGSYRIEPVLTGEVFTATASKGGYQTVSQTYRVDSPIGPAGLNPPFLDFKLSR
jgi:hypothetical protein